MNQHSTLDIQIMQYINTFMKNTQGKNPEETKVEISGELLIIFLKGTLEKVKYPMVSDERKRGLEEIVGLKIIDSYDSFTIDQEAACSVYIFEKKIKPPQKWGNAS